MTLKSRVAILGAANASVIVMLGAIGCDSQAQTTLSAGTIRAASAVEYLYPIVDNADAAPDFMDVFPTPLAINTSGAGPFIITFSAHCDMRAGTHPSGGIMLVNVTIDGGQVAPAEVEMMRGGPGESRGTVCSYTWMSPNVLAGQHQVQARLRIFGGFGGGFARVLTSTMTVLHEK